MNYCFSVIIKPLLTFNLSLSLPLLLFSLSINPIRSFDIPTLDDLTDTFFKLVSPTEGVFTTLPKPDPEISSSKKKKKMKRQSADIGDESSLPYEIRSSALPMNPDNSINTRYMPTLGNGYIATTAFSDKIHLNGLFNGKGSRSHRAAIPSILMSRARMSNSDYEKRATRKFTYNARDGYFMESITSDFAYIEQRIYLHQKYIRLYVNEIFVKMRGSLPGGSSIDFQYPAVSSVDIDFKQPLAYLGNWELSGTTKESENGEALNNVFIFYQRPVNQISVSGSNSEANYTFIMSIDKEEVNARTEFDQAMRLLQQPRELQPNWNFFQEHVNEWRRTWDNGCIELSGSSNPQLSKIVWMAQSYILNSLPAESPYLPPLYKENYYGLGRTSSAKGAEGRDYQGHVMWDNEMYLMPAVLLFHPRMAKMMLRYRSAMAKGAAQNAKNIGAPGYMYPWESAYTGIEVTPDPCPLNDTLCHQRKLYVTSGVAWAIRQYYSTTRDREYMIDPYYLGCDVSREVTRFLASRVTFNATKGRYEVLDITGPDNLHPRVNNNAFVLCSISLAIHFAKYFSCICDRVERAEVPDEVMRIAFYLDLPYDNKKRIHYQYDGFNPAKDRPIVQADTIMMGYPLNWNYSTDIMWNDLNLYEDIMQNSANSMSLSWFVIGWKWTGEQQKLNAYFLNSYQDYIIQPFKIWTEKAEKNILDQRIGNVNFLPAMGAFLQSLIYGFGGFRIRPNRLEIFRPIPPPGHTKMTFRNLNYLSNNLTFDIEPTKTTITVLQVNPAFPLYLRVNDTANTEYTLTNGLVLTIEPSSVGFIIYTVITESCEQPRDYIYIPWGYRPLYMGSAHVYKLTPLTLFITLMLQYFIISKLL